MNSPVDTSLMTLNLSSNVPELSNTIAFLVILIAQIKIKLYRWNLKTLISDNLSNKLLLNII